jgi:hypothetical protein
MARAARAIWGDPSGADRDVFECFPALGQDREAAFAEAPQAA